MADFMCSLANARIQEDQSEYSNPIHERSDSKCADASNNRIYLT